VEPAVRDLILILDTYYVEMSFSLAGTSIVDVESCRQSTLSPVLIFQSSVARRNSLDSADGSQCEGRPCGTRGARLDFDFGHVLRGNVVFIGGNKDS
jgi:hypothetical protein